MKRILRGAAWALGALVLAAAIAIGAGLVMSQQRAARTVSVEVQPVAYASGPEVLARGAYLYGSRGCGDCHGADGGGRTLVDDGKGTKIAGPNVTGGNPKLAAYKEADWVRSIRHGVAPGGHVLRVMPSEDYNRMSNEDLAALVAHVRQLPSKSGNLQPIVELPLVARVIHGFGGIPDAFDKIDHRLPPTAALQPTPTAAYGEYVAQMCKGCHGGQLQGGRIPGAPPEWPPASRLAAGEGSVMSRYADLSSFQAMFKSGKRPDGSPIAVMPFEALRQLNDNDVQALFAFLKRAP